MPNCHILPRPLLAASVTPILLVYVIFFISQWDYYLSAFTHVLPDDLTYATYARSGFFELCWICGINALLLLVFSLFIRRSTAKRDILRTVYATLISLFTLILIATALSKMALYIDTYGLTQKRVYASWLMLLLGVVFILVLLRQFIPRIPLVACGVITCLVFIALITIPDIDGMIATYNVNAYLSGDLSSVDVNALAGYGASAVPALTDLRDALTARGSLSEAEIELLANTTQKLDYIAFTLDQLPNTFFSFNLPIARARALLS